MSENEKKSNYGSPRDWGSILAGVGEGASSALQGISSTANSKREAREAKRRTLSKLVNQAQKRNKDLFRVHQEGTGEMTDYQTRALQEAARGFVDSLRGSSIYLK